MVHRRQATIWVLAALLLLALAVAVQAATPIRILADEGLLWHLAQDELMVEGDVLVEYEDIRLTCQRLVVDTQDDTFEASGEVTYHQDGDEISADYLMYDFDRETASFRRASVVLQDDEITGDAYLVGEELTRQDGNTIVSEAGLTGCDLAEPHYHLQATEIEYYPEDRIILRHVSYYEGRFKLFTLPVLVISLKDNKWETPKIGHNPSDGWFIKTTYNYYRNPAWLGSLFVDYYQLKGWGLGVRHDYQLDGRVPASGWLYGYAKQNGRSGQPLSYQTAFFYQPELPTGYSGELKGEYRRSYLREQIFNDWGATARFAWQEAAKRVSLSYNSLNKNPAELYTGSIYQNEQLITAFEDRPRPDLRYALSTNFTARQRVGLPTEEPSRFVQGWVTQSFPDYSLSLKVEHKYNPIYSNNEEVPPWKSYTLWPEVRLTTRRLKLGQKVLPLTASVSASRIQEEPGNHSLMRATGQLNLTGISQRLSNRTSVTTTGSLAGNYYDTNNAQIQANTRTILRYMASRSGRLTLTHNWTGRLGISPISYDLAEPTHNLQARADYMWGKWRAYLVGGYNLIVSEPEDLTAEVGYRHNQQIYSSLQWGYALPEQTWKFAKLSAAYLPDREHKLTAGIYYDFTQQIWREVSIELSQTLSPLWSLEAEMDWDGLYGGRLIKGRVGLTRDLHCRKIKISVDAVQEELWFELLFDLFPTEKLRFGATESEFLVDFDLPQSQVTR